MFSSSQRVPSHRPQCSRRILSTIIYHQVITFTNRIWSPIPSISNLIDLVVDLIRPTCACIIYVILICSILFPVFFIQEGFSALRRLDGWGNARDVDKVWKASLQQRADRVVHESEGGCVTQDSSCSVVWRHRKDKNREDKKEVSLSEDLFRFCLFYFATCLCYQAHFL